MNIQRQSGFTLIEAMITLAVTLGLISVIMVYAGSTNLSRQTYGAVANVQSIVSATNKIFGPAQKTAGAPYAGLTTSLISAQLGPDMSVAGGSIRNTYGGAVNIYVGNTYGTAGDSYYITFSGVPAKACVDFVGKVVGMSPQVAVGVTPLIVLALGAAQPTGAQIATACSTVAPSGTTNVYITEF
jgi:type II secretory pathway pseudopilin PulG